MKLQELIKRFRTLANDKTTAMGSDGSDLFWSDQDVVDWLNDAEQEACIRGRLLREDSLPAMCQIPLVQGQYTYQLHPKLYEIISLGVAAPAGAVRRLQLKSREWLDINMPEWREWPRLCGKAIQDETSLRIVGQFDVAEILFIECYRLPLQDMALPDPDAPDAVIHDTPEIHEAHHRHLIQWALYQAFSVPDSEAFDPQRAAAAEQAFTQYFGIRPDSGLRRETRTDVTHHVRGYLQ